MAITGTAFDSSGIDEELRGIDKRIAEEVRLAKITEQNRIEQMECPVCKSNDKTRNNLVKDNGVFGPGCESHVVLTYYVCNDCGVHYSDLKKK
jgi:C4-type Zn-finger protein